MTLIQIPEDQWSEPEKWVWQAIRAGQIADFNEKLKEGRGTPLKTKTSQGWDEKRKLRSGFLNKIFLSQPYNSQIPAEGVRIDGAWFAEAVELGHSRLAGSLWLENCRFEEPVHFEGLQIDGWFSLGGSTFAKQGTGAISVDLSSVKIGGHLILEKATFDGKLNMNELNVAQNLFTGNRAAFKDVEIVVAKVGGQLSLNGATFDGKLTMHGLDVAQHLLMGSGATFKKDVEITDAKVGGQLDLNGATFDGKLTISDLDIAQHLFMGDRAAFKDVGITVAKVGGQLHLNGATFDGKLTMNGLDVAQGLFMGNGATFNDDVEMIVAKIGVQLNLNGAMFGGKLKMSDLDVAQGRFMGNGATFKKDVEITDAKIGSHLILEKAMFDGKLNMNGLNAAQSLSMGNGAMFKKDVEIADAKIGSHLILEKAMFDGKLNMNGLDVAQRLSMRNGATFKDEVEIIDSRIGGRLILEDAMFDGKLYLHGLNVAQSLSMGNGATFKKDVEIIATKVSGRLILHNATFARELYIDSLVVEGEVSIQGSKFNQKVSLLFARFGMNFNLSDSELTGLDLSGSRIEGELRLGSDRHIRTRWGEGATLGLRNVDVGSLQDRRDKVTEQREKRSWWPFGDRERWEDAWPAKLQLSGFTYDRLGGIGGEPDREKKLQSERDVDMQARHVQWYLEWLDHDQSYNPQPYEQLAGVFRAAGDPGTANRILYESHLRARKEAWRHCQYFRWFGSSLLNWTIGYGIGGHYFRALGWVFMFTAIGAGVLYYSGQPFQGLAPGLPARFVYSLDQLLPIVEFERYDNVVLTGMVAYYFYIQKLAGWALGSFLVAGLAGLTQKQ